VAAAAGGGSAATAARSLSPTPYAQTNGASQNISGAFTNITSTTTTGVNWYRSEFRGGTVIADIGPSAAFYAEFLTMTAQPGGNTHGAYASGADLAQFRRWYSQAGTPRIDIRESHDPATGVLTLTMRQETPPTPGQPVKEPLHIPVALGLIGPDGKDLPVRLVGESEGAVVAGTRILSLVEAKVAWK
jgi:hypothetical protein